MEHITSALFNLLPEDVQAQILEAEDSLEGAQYGFEPAVWSQLPETAREAVRKLGTRASDTSAIDLARAAQRDAESALAEAEHGVSFAYADKGTLQAIISKGDDTGRIISGSPLMWARLMSPLSVGRWERFAADHATDLATHEVTYRTAKAEAAERAKETRKRGTGNGFDPEELDTMRALVKAARPSNA